jgi:hypothetical protein
MTAQPDDPIDWSLTTWKGSRLQQHRAFHALSFARKLELVEEMSATAGFFGRKQEKASAHAVNEDPPGAKPVDRLKARQTDPMKGP